MKKILLSFLAVLSMAAPSKAQLANGTVFPDFTLYSITGQKIHLDSLLDAGLTVFIDISATWCHPCWEYHISGALDTLYQQHGPIGWSGVDATSTGDVVVLFVQGESTSHLAELYDGPGATVGSASVETPYATSSQGNWVAGSPYPIIDDTTSTDPVVGTAALDAAWHIAYFPTVYMICRDRLVTVLNQPTAVEAYAAATSGTCPAYAPAPGTSVDAKAVPYSGTGYFICTANPTVNFQNYSTASTITSATLTVQDATGATVATQPWTGSLAPYAVTSVPFTSFAGNSSFGYSFSVNVAGDIRLSNDSSQSDVFNIYDTLNSISLPTSYVESFGTPTITAKYWFRDPDGFAIWSNTVSSPSTGAPVNIIGPSGSNDSCLWFDDHDASTPTADGGPGYTDHPINFVFGNFNSEGATNYFLSFDAAYAALSGVTATDQLQVQVSTDCGDSWTTTWSATGSALETAPTFSSGWFIPSGAGQWKHYIASLGGEKSKNLMIQIAGVTPGTAGNGELIYVDNIGFTTTNSVQQVSMDNQVSVYPNPAKEMTYVVLNLLSDANISIELSDALGRVITTINQQVNSGSTQIEVPTAELPTGIYNVKIANGSSVTVKKLSVIR